jgi:hypothetical protein
MYITYYYTEGTCVHQREIRDTTTVTPTEQQLQRREIRRVGQDFVFEKDATHGMFSIPFCRAQCKTFFGTVHALAAVQAPSKLPVRQSGFFGSENTKETIKTQYNVHQRPCKKTTTSDYCSMNHSKMSIDFNFFSFQNGTINTPSPTPTTTFTTYVRAQPSQRLNRSSGCWLVFLVGGATLFAKAVVAVLSACFT